MNNQQKIVELASASFDINHVPVGDVYLTPQPAGAVAKVWKAAVPRAGQRRQNNSPAHVERQQDGPAHPHTSPNIRGALHRQSQVHNF